MPIPPFGGIPARVVSLVGFRARGFGVWLESPVLPLVGFAMRAWGFRFCQLRDLKRTALGPRGTFVLL